MLTVSKNQYQQLGRVVFEGFKEELVEHCKTFSLPLCQAIGDDGVRAVVDRSVGTARKYDFTRRGPIRLCTEMTLLFGSFFDTDPQYPWIARILANPEDRTERQLAHQLYHATLDYLDTVNGPDDIHTLEALKRLSLLAQGPLEVRDGHFVHDLLQHFHQVYPQKLAYSGDPVAIALIEKGAGRAARSGFKSVRARALICILMFAFGHGCFRDPLYPWIARTLRDPRLPDPESRAGRLERKSITWLEQVIATF